MPNPSKPQHTYEPESRDDWLDRLAQFNQHFGRFARDAFGVFLIATALITILALGGWTDGMLLTPWAEFLSLWFGWGAYLVVTAIGYAGFAVLRRDGLPMAPASRCRIHLASARPVAETPRCHRSPQFP